MAKHVEQPLNLTGAGQRPPAPAVTPQFATQHTDTFIDHAILPPAPHRDEATARRYAIELTSRRRGECAVIDPNGRKLDVYEEGLGKAA